MTKAEALTYIPKVFEMERENKLHFFDARDNTVTMYYDNFREWFSRFAVKKVKGYDEFHYMAFTNENGIAFQALMTDEEYEKYTQEEI